MEAEDDGHRLVRDRVMGRLEGIVGDPELARRLEVAHWNRTITTFSADHGAWTVVWANPAFRYRYTTRSLGLEYNLRKAPGVLDRLRAGTLAPKTLVAMSPQEVWPERWEDAYARLAVRQLRREADVDAASAPDGAYTCGKCKSKKTVYTSIQIRSADEPMVRLWWPLARRSLITCATRRQMHQTSDPFADQLCALPQLRQELERLDRDPAPRAGFKAPAGCPPVTWRPQTTPRRRCGGPQRPRRATSLR